MKEVFGYLRVSGKGQLDGDGFERQRAAIEQFAASRGWRVIRFFEEKAVSGTTECMDRPAFSEMVGMIGGAMPDTIIVERCDRLARDLIVSELIFEECRKAGAKVYAADSGEELVSADGDPTRKLIRQVLGALAEWSKSEIVKKLRSARNRKKLATGRCEGAIPFEKRPNAQFIVDLIVRWRDKGSSFINIAQRLNDRGLHAPRGGRWSDVTVAQVWKRVTRDPGFYKSLPPIN